MSTGTNIGSLSVILKASYQAPICGKITREQIAAILYRYAGSPAASSSALNGFADQSAVSSYAVTAMQWAVGNGIITGVSTNGRTTLSAKNNATRAQVSVMLHRFLTMEQ